LSVNLHRHDRNIFIVQATGGFIYCHRDVNYDLKCHIYIGEGNATTLKTMTHNGDTLVLALATLGGATEVDMILSESHRPRWPRQEQSRDCHVSL
jgi:hypothetical protein